MSNNQIEPMGVPENSVFVPFSEMETRNINGDKKVGLRTKFSEFFRYAKRKSRQQNPIAPNAADIVNWILYDRWVNAASATLATQNKFFTVPQGTNSKTGADTNLTQVSQLEAPQWFNTIGVGFNFNTDATKADIDLFIRNFYMEFWVSQKVYLQGRFETFPGASGLSGYTTQTSQATWTLGVPSVNDFFDVRLPAGINLGSDAAGSAIVTDGLIGVTILQGQSFYIKAANDTGNAVTLLANNATPTPGTGLTIYAYLYGILSRGVQ